MSIEQTFKIELRDLTMIVEALRIAGLELHGYSGEHIEHVRNLLTRIGRAYTADRRVDLVVFKDPLLR